MSVTEIVILLVGLLAGSLVNRLIYTVAYNPRPISPWSHPSPDAPARRWSDRLPVIGWFGLRRETAIHGQRFWLRPMFIEIAMAAGLLMLYRHEMSGELFPSFFRQPKILVANSAWLWTLFTVHSLLIVLMAAATFIDFDERTIPDAITLPGTVLGLVAAAITPNVFLPAMSMTFTGSPGGSPLEPTLLHVPGVWPSSLSSGYGLLLGLAIVGGWCFALLDRRVILRRGWKNAIRFFFARMFRDPLWKVVVAVPSVVAVGVVCVWFIGGDHWQGLLTALVGLAVGGGVVWSVRLVAGWAMGVEAMGFGDVILLGMIGVFIGWQAALLAFMAAPFTSLAISLTNYLVTGENRLAFGPYLCAGSLIVIVFWEPIWNPPTGYGHVFTEPLILFEVFVVALAAMGIMLRLLRLARGG